MGIVQVIFPAVFALFLWSYIMTYFMSQGASSRFLNRARRGVFLGMIVALVFIFFDLYYPHWIGQDWFLFPLIFLITSCYFSWKIMRYSLFLPLLLSCCLFLASYFLDTAVVWSPFHEEVGKWYQSIASQYPALMSPFVSIGFGFVENIRYYSVDSNIAQILGRSLFSLPLHIFIGLFAFWCFFVSPSRILGLCLGITAAVGVHTLYNWSLTYSIMITLPIMIGGYAFFGWSLENGWWKRKI